VSFRDDGDALLARNEALAAENARLRAENDRLKDSPEPAPAALVAPPRAGEQALVVKPVGRWKRWGIAAVLWVAAVAVAIAQGLIPL
jgi:hypothetical protein